MKQAGGRRSAGGHGWPAGQGRTSGSGAADWQEVIGAMRIGVAVYEIIVGADGVPRDYRFIDVNPAYEAITGLERADLIGRSASEVQRGVAGQWLDRFAAVALGGSSGEFDDFSGDLDRHYRVSVVRTGERRVTVLIDDVSRVHRQMESLRQVAHAFADGRQAVVTTDIDGCILAVSPAFCRLLGRRRSELIGRQARTVGFGHRDPLIDASMWFQLARDGTWQGPLWGRRPDGRVYRRWLSIGALYDQSGTTASYLGVLTHPRGRLAGKRHENPSPDGRRGPEAAAGTRARRGSR